MVPWSTSTSMNPSFDSFQETIRKKNGTHPRVTAFNCSYQRVEESPEIERREKESEMISEIRQLVVTDSIGAYCLCECVYRFLLLLSKTMERHRRRLLLSSQRPILLLQEQAVFFRKRQQGNCAKMVCVMQWWQSSCVIGKVGWVHFSYAAIVFLQLLPSLPPLDLMRFSAEFKEEW